MPSIPIYIKAHFKVLPHEQMRDVYAPFTEMGIYITHRIVQASSVVALGMAALRVATSKPQTLTRFLKCVQQYGTYSLLMSGYMGSMYACYKITDCAETFGDRWIATKHHSMAIRYNRDSMRLDNASLAGTLIGIAYGWRFGNNGIVRGIVIGMPVGTLLALTYNKIFGEKEYPYSVKSLKRGEYY